MTNGTCQFYDNQIFNEVCPKERKKETLRQFVDECREEFKEMFESDINTEKALYLTAIAETMDTSRREELTNKPKPAAVKPAAVVGGDKSAASSKPAPKKPAGFTIDTTDTSEPQQPAPVESATVGGYKIGSCALCGQPFKMRTTWQKYCCEAHKLQYNANIKGYTIKGVAPNYIDFPNITKV